MKEVYKIMHDVERVDREKIFSLSYNSRTVFIHRIGVSVSQDKNWKYFLAHHIIKLSHDMMITRQY